jgi:hypothetical protein
VHFFDADGLAGKDRAEIDFLSAETNAATVCDDDGAVKRVVDVRQYGVPSRRRLTNLCRTFHVQGFVRSLVLEDLDEIIEAYLLRAIDKDLELA